MPITKGFLGLFFLLFIAIANCENCEIHDWHQTSHLIQCSKGMSKIFEDNFNNQRYMSCCKPNTSEEESYRQIALQCRTTECEVLSGDSCSYPYLSTRIYQNEPLVYEEVSRTSCGTGIEIAYCCRKNSTESLLATLYGAEQNEFPHMAKLPNCGGTIYNKRYILTAAHCVVDKDTGKEELIEDILVKVGRNVAAKDIPENNYAIEKIIVHEGYSLLAGSPELEQKYPLSYNDIALLRLTKDIEFGENVKSLEIAPKGFVENEFAQNGVILGWGKTVTNRGSDHLQKTNVFIREDESCFGVDGNSPYPDFYDYREQLLCVGGIMDGIYSGMSGSGDSGGPAVCRGKDGHPVLCGIASFSKGTPEEKTKNCVEHWNEKYCSPSGYAEVDHFWEWIKQNAGDQDESTFHKPWLYGSKATKTALSHQVHITSAGGKPCGGTLITPTTIITAAQCVSSCNGTRDTYSDVQIIFGLEDVLKPEETGTIHEIKSIHILPGFQQVTSQLEDRGFSVEQLLCALDSFYQNDLAVIKLKKGVNVARSQLPRLPEADGKLESPAYELAFQRDTKDFGYTDIGGKLTQRQYSILDKDECQRRIDRMARIGLGTEIDENILCGVEKYLGGSTCDRELRGGLICKGKDNKDLLCGVQVWRLCKWSVPNGFLDVRSHLDWITKFL